eukprot:CAMPEP_0119555054 /NCGR_PEP_ID=MMETSP1352-20130426/7375_1 /TAXON_ID=265584 /ORGANISM="Stauroneis constricta, Strain CCMP1120" /LENGTH=1374 /DNA_ID=CAMNT_0007601755 /DNA_START=86 /DNA_END=4210 /DNA_ORIENTATION=-
MTSVLQQRSSMNFEQQQQQLRRKKRACRRGDALDQTDGASNGGTSACNGMSSSPSTATRIHQALSATARQSAGVEDGELNEAPERSSPSSSSSSSSPRRQQRSNHHRLVVVRLDQPLKSQRRRSSGAIAAADATTSAMAKGNARLSTTEPRYNSSSSSSRKRSRTNPESSSDSMASTQRKSEFHSSGRSNGRDDHASSTAAAAAASATRSTDSTRSNADGMQERHNQNSSGSGSSSNSRGKGGKGNDTSPLDGPTDTRKPSAPTTASSTTSITEPPGHRRAERQSLGSSNGSDSNGNGGRSSGQCERRPSTASTRSSPTKEKSMCRNFFTKPEGQRPPQFRTKPHEQRPRGNQHHHHQHHHQHRPDGRDCMRPPPMNSRNGNNGPPPQRRRFSGDMRDRHDHHDRHHHQQQQQQHQQQPRGRDFQRNCDRPMHPRARDDRPMFQPRRTMERPRSLPPPPPSNDHVRRHHDDRPMRNHRNDEQQHRQQQQHGPRNFQQPQRREPSLERRPRPADDCRDDRRGANDNSHGNMRMKQTRDGDDRRRNHHDERRPMMRSPSNNGPPINRNRNHNNAIAPPNCDGRFNRGNDRPSSMHPNRRDDAPHGHINHHRPDRFRPSMEEGRPPQRHDGRPPQRNDGGRMMMTKIRGDESMRGPRTMRRSASPPLKRPFVSGHRDAQQPPQQQHQRKRLRTGSPNSDRRIDRRTDVPPRRQSTTAQESKQSKKSPPAPAPTKALPQQQPSLAVKAKPPTQSKLGIPMRWLQPKKRSVQQQSMHRDLAPMLTATAPDVQSTSFKASKEVPLPVKKDRQPSRSAPQVTTAAAQPAVGTGGSVSHISNRAVTDSEGGSTLSNIRDDLGKKSRDAGNGNNSSNGSTTMQVPTAIVTQKAAEPEDGGSPYLATEDSFTACAAAEQPVQPTKNHSVPSIIVRKDYDDDHADGVVDGVDDNIKPTHTISPGISPTTTAGSNNIMNMTNNNNPDANNDDDNHSIMSSSSDSSSSCSESDTDEEELMNWASKMFGIPQKIAHKKGQNNATNVNAATTTTNTAITTTAPPPQEQQYDEPTNDAPRKIPSLHLRLSLKKLKRETERQDHNKKTKSTKKHQDNQDDAAVVTSKKKKTKKKKTGTDMEKYRKEREERKRIKESAKPLTVDQIRAILAEDEGCCGGGGNWVRRSMRDPSRGLLNTPQMKIFLEKVRNNHPEMVVLKMKKYISDPNAPPALLNAALDALEENSNCQALYIQNFNLGMRDKQLLHLLKILQQPSCKIWCINVGELYNIKNRTWEKFTKGLKKTNITHMYASEHRISTEMKDDIRATIRNNRSKHDLHINPNNLNVIIQCTHCWWNPINAKVLRPYIRGWMEHILQDREAQGLRGSTSSAPG